MLYHLSKTNMNNKTLTPRIPDNYFTKNGYEDNKIARVCFTDTIDKSLMAISMRCKGLELYVHVPIEKHSTYKPNTSQVPDSKITGETWIKEPVKIKCIGVISVIDDAGENGISFKYGNNSAELYKWNWKWKKKFNDNLNEEVSMFLKNWG